MTVSYLTTSEDGLYSSIIAAFVADDYAFNPLLISADEYLVGVLNGLTGSSFSHLTMSRDEVLARIASNLTGSSVSHLRTTQDELLDLVLANHEGAGGDEVPEWVPENAKVVIDFKNDRAWTETDGLVPIDTLAGEDAAVSGGWASNEYDPDGLTADGYVYRNTVNQYPDIGLIGTAKTVMLAGATMALRGKDVDLGPFTDFEMRGVVVSADGNNYQTVLANGPSRKVEVDTPGPLSNIDPSDPIINVLIGTAINQVAWTITDTRYEVAANGVQLFEEELDEDDNPPSNPVAGVGVRCSKALEKIVIYDALPSSTGLDVLSETGVTNTAPTNLRADNWQGFYTSTTSTVATVSASELVGASPELVINTADYLADDAEGNPLTLTLVDDDGGNFVLDVNNVQIIAELSADTHIFILRATDTGGLYVEQEFTITVTA